MAQEPKASAEHKDASNRPNQPLFGALVAQTTLAAADLGVFQRLVDGPATAAILAQATEANERALTMVLDALVATGQLEKTDGEYRLPPGTRKLLAVPGVEPNTFFADSAAHARALVTSWSKLLEVVRSGKPANDIVDPATAEQFFVSLVRMLFPGNFLISQALFEATRERFGHGEVQILDVAAGAGPWGMAFADGNPEARVTAVDFPAVLEVTRSFAKAHGVEDRYSFVPGNLREVDLGEGKFDLALLGHICHSEGERNSRQLFGKVFRALKPGGTMAVADMIADDERRGEKGGAPALIFALNMLVHTPEGGTFTWPEYQAWAKEAGFSHAELVDIPAPSPMMLFRK